ncbi:MAG: methyltransferase domain-containing protein [Bradyrhizobium sp.]|uniref:class I SAM-dependent methyltransferase n=1 Tax=Bradyrhizobium sp. TaxID=376 RepID=UPI001DE84AD2|nr:class I SAM-dependent methyltransferase [Bradyrhizobium sp.]MBV9560791.1 methyltransferase domain-containing protein [Bradyrhizobium sp.]
MANASLPLSAQDAERLRRFERERHDTLAATYHDFFTPITALAIQPLLDAAGVGAGSNLLDIATGPGSVAARARRLGAACTGVDLSQGMIALARVSHPDIDFRIAEVEHLPFADRSFDVVVCNFGLGHFPWPEAAVAECARTLKVGGRVAFSWWDQPDKQRVQGLFREAVAEVGAALPPDVPAGHSNLRFCDATEFRKLLVGAGLDDVRVDDHRASYTIADVDTLWRGGLGSFAVTASAIVHQDAATQAAIRASLERRAAVYRTPAGLVLPVAFRIGSGQRSDQ